MQTFSNIVWIILVVFNILINFSLNFLQSSQPSLSLTVFISVVCCLPQSCAVFSVVCCLPSVVCCLPSETVTLQLSPPPAPLC